MMNLSFMEVGRSSYTYAECFKIVFWSAYSVNEIWSDLFFYQSGLSRKTELLSSDMFVFPSVHLQLETRRPLFIYCIYYIVIHGERKICWHLVCVQNLGVVVNCGDFICVNCILCVGMLENFKLKLGFTLGWASCMH